MQRSWANLARSLHFGGIRLNGVYTIEAAHNPEVAGSNPAPRYCKRPHSGPFLYAKAGCSADEPCICADGAVRQDHRSNLVKHAVKARKVAALIDDRGGSVDGQRRVIRPVQVEGHGSGHAVHRPGKRLDVMKARAPVRMDDQGAVDRRGTFERAGIGGRRAQVDDEVVASYPDAVEGRRRVADGPARRGRRRRGGARRDDHRQEDSEWDEQQTKRSWGAHWGDSSRFRIDTNFRPSRPSEQSQKVGILSAPSYP